MNRVDAMHIYLRVAELASFTQAADSLGLPKSSVSGAVKQLETWLGTRLLHRTTRSVQMTHDGLIFYERSKDMLADMAEMEALFQQDAGEISGRLRMDLPVGVARNIIIPQLPVFLQRHPRLEIELSTTDRRVDLIREGFDCVMRIGHLTDSTLVARPLGHLRQINCASPVYLARYGIPEHLDDLRQHQLIHYTSSFGGKPAGFEYNDGHQTTIYPMSGSITVNNSDAYQAACLAGLGLIQAPEIGTRELLVQGRLVAVLPDFPAQAMPVSLLYANRRHLPKRTRSLMNWVVEVMQPYLLTVPDAVH